MQVNKGRCAMTAVAVAGVLALAACGDRVENTEMPVPPQANVEINRHGMEGAKEVEEAIGVRSDNSVRIATGDTSVMDPDVLLAERVRAAIAAHPQAGALEVDVRTDEGEVTLSGRAADEGMRERAGEIARAVPTVKSVDNQLTVG
jgi:osmotically-inducible protein OsmY